MPRFLADRLYPPETDVDDKAGDESDSSSTVFGEDGVMSPQMSTASLNDEDDELPKHSHLGEQYWANDGVVPLFSQWHPGGCK